MNEASFNSNESNTFMNVGLWLLGQSWQSEMASVLGVDRRRIVHYKQATATIPHEVWMQLRSFAEHRLLQAQLAIKAIDKQLESRKPPKKGYSGSYVLSVEPCIRPNDSPKLKELIEVFTQGLGMEVMDVDNILDRNQYMHFYVRQSTRLRDYLKVKLGENLFKEAVPRDDSLQYEDMVNIVRLCRRIILKLNNSMPYQVFIDDANNPVPKTIDRNDPLWNIKDQLPRTK